MHHIVVAYPDPSWRATKKYENGSQWSDALLRTADMVERTRILFDSVFANDAFQPRYVQMPIGVHIPPIPRDADVCALLEPTRDTLHWAALSKSSPPVIGLFSNRTELDEHIPAIRDIGKALPIDGSKPATVLPIYQSPNTEEWSEDFRCNVDLVRRVLLTKVA